MAVSEKAEQKSIDEIFLADNNMRNLLAESRNPAPKLLDFTSNFLCGFHVFFDKFRQNLARNVRFALNPRSGVDHYFWLRGRKVKRIGQPG